MSRVEEKEAINGILREPSISEILKHRRSDGVPRIPNEAWVEGEAILLPFQMPRSRLC